MMMMMVSVVFRLRLSSIVFVCLLLMMVFTNLQSTTATPTSATSYDGDEVIEVIVDSDEKLEAFSIMVKRFQVNMWKERASDTGKCLIHVSSANKQQLKDGFERIGIVYRTVIANLQTQIDRERESNPEEGVALPWMSTKGSKWNSRRNSGGRKRRRRKRQSSAHSIVGKYATYEEICDWMRETSLAFPNVTRLEVIGKTFEGRDLLVLKIGDQRSTVKKPGIWLDAGTHAREWITVSSAIYIISQILTNYYNGPSATSDVGGEKKNATTTNDDDDDELSLIESVDWFILPIVNPDGYAFTHDVNGNRLWRKNRSFYPNSSYSEAYNMTCLGTDINRNFDFNWNYYGTLNESCYVTYCGPRPSSENETQAIKNFFLTHNSSIHGYVTIHSFGQLFMVRWAYSVDAPHTPEFNDTLAVANEAVEAINRTSGFVYLAGTSPEILYAFSGGSGDWVRANTRIKHVYDVELRDQGEFGFILPAENIIPVGQELWEAIKVVATHVLEDHPPTTEDPLTTTADHPPTTTADHPPTTTADHPPTTTENHPPTTTTVVYSNGGQTKTLLHSIPLLLLLLLLLGRMVIISSH